MISLINPTNFRFALTCATLAERPLHISDIHGDDEVKGLREHEIKFLEMLEKISTGTKIEIGKSGQSVRYYPGIIINNNGMEIEIDCGLERSLGYFIEPLICLALFGKQNLEITLKGVTNDEIDVSVDYLIQTFIPLLKNFGLENLPQIKILKRGFKPLGGGEIHISLNFVKFLKAVDFSNKGKVKKIRGIAYASKIAIQSLNRMISSVREVFNDYLSDVWIYSDYNKGNKAGQSPGYGISLIAENLNGAVIGVDEVFKIDKLSNDEENLPENIGKKCALRLLDEIYYSGYVDSSIQGSIFLLMALSEKKVSSITIGRITPYTIDNLRLIRDFFGVVFKIDEFIENNQETNNTQKDDIEEENNDNASSLEEKENTKISPKFMSFKCLGIGLANIARNTN